MLYVKGIAITVKNAGKAISNLSHSISLSDCAIKAPTIINAGAVTCVVTTDKSGEKKYDANATYNTPQHPLLEAALQKIQRQTHGQI